VIRYGIAEPTESIPVDVPDKQYVDVAPDVIGARREGPEDQRESNATHLLQFARQDLRDPALAAEKVADAGDAVTCGVDRPQPQVADAPAGKSARLKKVIKRQLGGMRIGLDATSDLARVEFVPWAAYEQVEGSARRRAAPQKFREECHRAHLTTIVVAITTVVVRRPFGVLVA
jgi:hypothetical protein